MIIQIRKKVIDMAFVQVNKSYDMAVDSAMHILLAKLDAVFHNIITLDISRY